jgi:predicted alpha/beta-fold hydrolase
VNQFTPPKGLSNRHLQSILSSTGPRKLLEKRRAKELLENAKEYCITTPQGVNLLGFITHTEKKSKGLAIILHGWEGCADSLYVLSSGQKLLDDGFDVFRLNFRDHGETHHLNKDLFNSTRLQEVLEAVKFLCHKFGGEHNLLCGYSLGGNFCLRVANVAKQEKIALHQAIAICPLLHPPTTMDMLNNGFPIYEKYFVKKWKRSLFKKLRYHPQFNYGDRLKKLKSLDQMNEFFVPQYTNFISTNDYFEAYSILGEGLKNLSIATTIISSLDDPIIAASQLNKLFRSPWLTIETQEYGGHCAFIKNWKFESWATDRISEIANQLSQ